MPGWKMTLPLMHCSLFRLAWTLALRRARGELVDGVMPMSTALGDESSTAEHDFVMFEGETNVLRSSPCPGSITS